MYRRTLPDVPSQYVGWASIRSAIFPKDSFEVSFNDDSETACQP
jgi:hypothetical protein